MSKTEIVWTSDAPITFKYMYQVDGNGSNGTVTSLIIGEAKHSSGAVCTEDSYTIYSDDDDVDAEGYSTISITHTGLPETGYKEQEVTIKAGTLMRTINLILINPYASQVGCSPTSGLTAVPPAIPKTKIDLGENKSVYVYFSMPAGLPESIFPLTFILSPDAHSITPTGGDMPVTSLLTHANSTMQGLKYGFEKVVTWDEYKDYASTSTGMVVECPFKTSLAESATNIYVYNEYFNFPLSTSFTNPLTANKTLRLYYYNEYYKIQSKLKYTTSSDEVKVSVTRSSDNYWSFTINYTEGSENETVTLTYSSSNNTYTYRFTVSQFNEFNTNQRITLTR